jgi:hypothetical protein
MSCLTVFMAANPPEQPVSNEYWRGCAATINQQLGVSRTGIFSYNLKIHPPTQKKQIPLFLHYNISKIYFSFFPGGGGGGAFFLRSYQKM